MTRVAVYVGVLLLLAGCCVGQQAAGGGQSGQDSTSAGQGSKSQTSGGQKPDSDGKAPSGSSSSTQNSAGQGATKDKTGQSSSADAEDDESSSRDTHIDTSAPKDDSKEHPDSKAAVGDLEAADSDVQEFHPWNPMKAMKDIEVGDYYFRRKNYKAALDRYKEALYYKDKDAVATYRLAVCEEKTGDKEDARKNFEEYLKILPDGPWAKEARGEVERLAGARTR